MTDYRVRTDVYNGPMDLLLYLIRREEVDIYDIPIAHVAGEYCRYIELLETIDPNVAGDFLVLAATLMEIKSRMLLPRQTGEETEGDDLGDPRLELVRQLLEYKKFKDASFELGAAAQAQALRWAHVPARTDRRTDPQIDLDDVQIWDLVAAFNKLMSAIGAEAASHEVIFDDTPIALHATDILDRLQHEGNELSFEDVFVGRNKIEMIGLFLALLELMRQQRVRITQADTFAPIRIVLLSAEAITIGEEWEPVIRDAVLGPQPSSAAQDAHDAQDADGASPAPPKDAAEEEDDRFEELERIRTDVDIDAVLDRARSVGSDKEPESNDP